MKTELKIPERVLRLAIDAGRSERTFQEDGYRPCRRRIVAADLEAMRAAAHVIVQYVMNVD